MSAMSENTHRVRSDCSVTDIISKTDSFTYTWKINNFQRLYEQEQNCIATPSSEGSADVKLWMIKIYINGHPNYNYTPVHLAAEVRFDTKAAEMSYDYYKLYVYTVDKLKNEHKVHESNKVKATTVSYSIPCLVKKEFVLSEENGVLADGNLTLKLEVIFTKNNVVSNSVNPLASAGKSGLIEFESMLNSDKFSDAKILVEGKEFPVHKVILATRSPVFAAMFEHGTRESIDNVIEIADIDAEIMQEVLSYVYTGEVKDLEGVAFDLLAAANKYGLGQLKLMCEEVLVRQLAVDNVTMLLMHAEAYAAETLKESAVQFFKLHAKEIVQTKSFETDFNALINLLPSIFKSLVLERGT